MTRGLNLLKDSIKREAIKRYSDRRLYPIWPFESFSVDEALVLHGVVSKALAEHGDEIDPDWDEEFAALARVVLEERSQARAVEDYNRRQQNQR